MNLKLVLLISLLSLFGDCMLNSENNKRFGEIMLTVHYIKAFLNDTGREFLLSNNIIFKGISWKIEITLHAGSLIFSLCSDVPRDFVWSCQTDFELSIVSYSKNDEFDMKKSFSHLFKGWKMNHCFDGKFENKIEQLMDKSLGLYNEKEDTMTFKAKLKAGKPFLIRDVSVDDTLLLNGQIIFVNKYILAAQSNFFKALFFGEKVEEAPKIDINFIGNAKNCFEQLISVINSPNFAVHEDCVENVLQLAKDFNMSAVEINRCREWESVKTDMEFGIVSVLKRDEWFLRERKLAYEKRFHHTLCRYYHELLDPIYGVYDEKEDAMTFKVEIIVINKKKESIIKFQAEDKLMVNGQVVNVNKYLLAAHSEFFKILFFEFNEQMPKIEIGNDKNAIGNFEKLISIMNSPNAELDDDCFENVLVLADRFLLDSVMNRCAHFLAKKSTKPFIHKYLLAHQYNFIAVKKKLICRDIELLFIPVDEYLYNINYLIEKFKIDEKALEENNLQKIYEDINKVDSNKVKNFYENIILLLEHSKFDAELVKELKVRRDKWNW